MCDQEAPANGRLWFAQVVGHNQKEEIGAAVAGKLLELTAVAQLNLQPQTSAFIGREVLPLVAGRGASHSGKRVSPVRRVG